MLVPWRTIAKCPTLFYLQQLLLRGNSIIEKSKPMVRIEQDKLIIEIESAAPAETLYGMQCAILSLLESYNNDYADWQHVVESTTLLKAMMPMMNEIDDDHR